jgi:hypothetical protein
MIFISGEIIAFFTFPGVIMHEIAHRFACDILRVPVYDVSYFTAGDSISGYVCHHKTDNIWHDFFIGFAPLFINTLFCIIFTLPYSSELHITGGEFTHSSNSFLYWVGLSMGAHAFPSNQDVHNILELSKSSQKFFIIGFLCDLMKLLNKLRFFWINFVYALGISMIVPFLLFGKCATKIS